MVLYTGDVSVIVKNLLVIAGMRWQRSFYVAGINKPSVRDCIKYHDQFWKHYTIYVFYAHCARVVILLLLLLLLYLFCTYIVIVIRPLESGIIGRTHRWEAGEWRKMADACDIGIWFCWKLVVHRCGSRECVVFLRTFPKNNLAPYIRVNASRWFRWRGSTVQNTDFHRFCWMSRAVHRSEILLALLNVVLMHNGLVLVTVPLYMFVLRFVVVISRSKIQQQWKLCFSENCTVHVCWHISCSYHRFVVNFLSYEDH
jgi:hypothetical protein